MRWFTSWREQLKSTRKPSHRNTKRRHIVGPRVEYLEARTLLNVGGLQLAGVSTTNVGEEFDLTVSALDDYGNLLTDYAGTVHFTCSDPLATCPPDYTFTLADQGQHTFHDVILGTYGTQTVTVKDIGSASIQIDVTNDVLNSSDSGVGSLRDAIFYSNASVGVVDTIRFAIGTGVQTIELLSPLPPITDSVILDATTQPGYIGEPIIELNGASAGPEANGLTLKAGNSTIKGLVINRFGGYGVVISDAASGNVIAGNYIGTDVTGTLDQGNALAGVQIIDGASNNTIGGSTAAARNVISGNNSDGIEITGSGTTGNIVQGNHIGVDKNGNEFIASTISWWKAEGNANDSVDGNAGTLVNGATFATGKVGQAFSFDGIDDYVQLPANSFPYPSSGTSTEPLSFETWFRTTSGGVILGQQTSAAFGSPTGWIPAVYVDTNGTLLIQMFWNGSTDPIASQTSVRDGVFHHVAITFNGTTETAYLDGTPIGSKNFTQTAYNGSYQYQFGTGYTLFWPGGNGGWYSFQGLVDEPAVYNRALTAAEIQAIYNAGDTGKGSSVSNTGSGIVMSSGASNNTIGGTAAGAGNLIAFNGVTGVLIADAGTVGNRVRGNSIHSNGIGIDLGGDGVTANDPGDADSGPNQLLNFPVLTHAQFGATTRVTGSIDSPGNGPFQIDFFTNPAADSTGHGQGRRFLGDATLASDGTFDVTLLAATADGELVSATLTDVAGNTSEFSLAIPFTSNSPPSAHAGGPYAIREGDTLTLDASQSSDPDDDLLTFSWDVNGDGVFGDAVGAEPTLTWSQLQALGIDDGPTTFNVRVRVSDESYAVDSAAVTVPLSNTDPSATFSNGGAVQEGSAGKVSFADLFDPSNADTLAGFRFGFDFDNDGVFEIVCSGAASTVVPAGYLADGPSTRTVKGRIEDKDGGYTDYTTTLAINNVAPAASTSGPAGGVPGQPRTFTFSALDPSTIDQAAGFVYEINWGDGSPAQTIDRAAGNGSGAAVDHIYTKTGIYPVQVTATDKDAGISASSSRKVTIELVQRQGNDLAIGGTLAGDEIMLSPGKALGGVNVLLRVADSKLVDADFLIPTGHILVYGQAGNDVIMLRNKEPLLTVPAYIYGGGDKDTISAIGSTANNVVWGDAGDDVLFGGQGGRDLLIGGAGADKIDGQTGGGSILIAGTTDYDLASNLMTYDRKLTALDAIMAEWGRTDAEYATRVSHLLGTNAGGTSGGLNGNYFLNASTVHDDDAIDTLWGSPTALDWFLARLSGTNQDTIKNNTQVEIVTGL